MLKRNGLFIIVMNCICHTSVSPKKASTNLPYSKTDHSLVPYIFSKLCKCKLCGLGADQLRHVEEYVWTGAGDNQIIISPQNINNIVYILMLLDVILAYSHYRYGSPHTYLVGMWACHNISNVHLHCIHFYE